MLNITVGTNTSRKKVVVAPNTTLRKVLSDNGVNTSVGTLSIDGTILSSSDLDKTLEELNVANNAYIIQVAKADNA
jgi:hypothetical protein